MKINQSMFLIFFINFVLNCSFKCQRGICESCRSFVVSQLVLISYFVIEPHMEDFHLFKFNLTRITVTHESLICLFLSHCFPVGKILPVQLTKNHQATSNSNMCNNNIIIFIHFLKLHKYFFNWNESMNTLYHTHYLTFLITHYDKMNPLSERREMQISKSHPQMFHNNVFTLAAKQGINPRTSRTVVFCAIGCATSTSNQVTP